MKKYVIFSVGILLSTLVLIACKKDPTTVTVPASNLTNVMYGNDVKQVMDVYLPENRSVDSTKVFVFIHGGGWVAGDKSDFNALYPYFKAELPDYAFISMSYRLCDTNANTNLFPTQENDVIAALDFIESKLTEWKVSDKVVLCGASAGGHLSLLHGYKNNNDHFVKAIVNYFGPTHMDSIYPYSQFTMSLLDEVLGGTPAEQPILYFNSSPANFVNANSIPTITFHGTNDIVVPIQQAYLLHQTLQNAGVVNEAKYYQGDGHGFSISNTLNSIERTRDFLEIVNP